MRPRSEAGTRLTSGSRAQPRDGFATTVIVRLCIQAQEMYAQLSGPQVRGLPAHRITSAPRITPVKDTSAQGVRLTTAGRHTYTEQQQERLRAIHSRLTEARRELDALIGDAYLRPRANIVPVHFLDLASATEKLRWAEKEWRELEREVAEDHSDHVAEEELDDALAEVVHAEGSRR
jgi:hypothetical protein